MLENNGKQDWDKIFFKEVSYETFSFSFARRSNVGRSADR
jgi:hypothetical protein